MRTLLDVKADAMFDGLRPRHFPEPKPLHEQVQLVEKVQPLVHAIWMSRHVPLGKVYRQWDSQGKLLIWVNKSVIENLPERELPKRTPLLSLMRFPTGIPVIDGDYPNR